MILLDTDHLSVLAQPDDLAYAPLVARMRASSESFATTVVSVEERLRGWLAEIHRRSRIQQQVQPYDTLADLIEFFHQWWIVRFDNRAADMFDALRKQRVRIGTMDLKIACIALVHNARLLSANARDFRQVPGLRVENWLMIEAH